MTHQGQTCQAGTTRERPAGITVNAAAQQKLDGFSGVGWTKAIAPAKVNLHLAIGGKRGDGFHDAVSILHAVNLHDAVYVRCAAGAPGDGLTVNVEMLGRGDVEVPDVPPERNIASRAVHELAQRIGRACDEVVDIRIEKDIPTQAGLGGGSADAAATLVALARLWGVDPASEVLVEAAHALGSDVAFFLHGGCAYFTGRGDVFDHELAPTNRQVVLVKTAQGVSTGAAYAAFDEQPLPVPDEVASAAVRAVDAADLQLFNNLAPASERLLPQLGEVRSWLEGQPGVEGALLCGSGSTTFAICDSFATACRVVADARTRGLWARTTAFSSIKATVAPKR